MHNLKYDKDENKFAYYESDTWHDIDTGEGVRDDLTTHENRKISGEEEVHGLRYVEEEDTLRISKSDGSTANFKPGVDPDLLCNDLVTGIDDCINKVGVNNA